ncbi:MAG: 2,3,4,5-tetrahydropyridine-2,6-dicarboxylate N-succinyltransferase [Dactylosporangium sp.]|nr:2,3,4,5-tetrahydropyridine-2,6-dicarboxylate N-succinyltransferase [Dactylosporangium sp.]NNJ63815.1 2,3,4,5-tetrahydropyridine-2,6-dicarboxylate N-succinyltransferase [Dactylosporangium sp.]
MSTRARVRATGSANRPGTVRTSGARIQESLETVPLAPVITAFFDTPAWGFGVATVTADGEVLDAWYPQDHLGLGEAGEAESPDGSQPHAPQVPPAEDRPVRGLRSIPITCVIDSLAAPPADALDAYLRLHLLSARMIRPHQANLEGIFGVLTNVAWTSAGPCPPDQVEQLRWTERAAGRRLAILGVDKFPRMIDYIVPSGVRVANGDRVRLGAHLAPGTTVMHEGFVNYNAGTLGASMIEGRISSGVVVDDGSDIGGGSSIMGTLSGGGKEIVRVGKRSLLGANAGIGISLGDDCVVEAGCYVTAGSKVVLPDGRIIKASELSGSDGLLFMRNSVTGTMHVRPRAGMGAALNPVLHANG